MLRVYDITHNNSLVQLIDIITLESTVQCTHNVAVIVSTSCCRLINLLVTNLSIPYIVYIIYYLYIHIA